MKRGSHNTLAMLAFTAAVGFSGAAGAKLIDRGGGLIYDDVLHITWLQNANLGAGSSFDDGFDKTDGRMTWDAAVAWADQLSYYDSVRKVTWSDWRLPTVKPVNGSAFQYFDSSDYWTGSRDESYNVSAPSSANSGSTASELAYMYYNNLDNIASLDISGKAQSGSGLVDDSSDLSDESLFTNLRPDGYWSGTEYAPDTTLAWGFDAVGGFQGVGFKDGDIYAWAVRSGDVVAAVPEPASIALVGLGLVGLGWARWRRG